MRDGHYDTKGLYLVTVNIKSPHRTPADNFSSQSGSLKNFPTSKLTEKIEIA